jgi:hypothetical protein
MIWLGWIALALSCAVGIAAAALAAAERFAPLLHPLRPDLSIEVLPGVDHMGIVTRHEAIRAIVAALREDGPGLERATPVR